MLILSCAIIRIIAPYGYYSVVSHGVKIDIEKQRVSATDENLKKTSLIIYYFIQKVIF